MGHINKMGLAHLSTYVDVHKFTSMGYLYLATDICIYHYLDTTVCKNILSGAFSRLKCTVVSKQICKNTTQGDKSHSFDNSEHAFVLAYIRVRL